MLTPEQLNALLVVCANAPIKGQDAKFMVELMGKLEAMKSAAENPIPPVPPPQD